MAKTHHIPFNRRYHHDHIPLDGLHTGLDRASGGGGMGFLITNTSLVRRGNHCNCQHYYSYRIPFDQEAGTECTLGLRSHHCSFGGSPSCHCALMRQGSACPINAISYNIAKGLQRYTFTIYLYCFTVTLDSVHRLLTVPPPPTSPTKQARLLRVG